MSLADLRKELRELRKESGHRPISKMKKADVAHELERLREKRETTAPVAATHGAAPRKMAPRAADVHESKEREHPVKPAEAGTKKGEERKTARKAYEGETPSKKKDLMAKMMKLMEEMD